ncbi:MAG: hypothetical protein HN509_18170 [Halobacteriovoraceae bacterium]|jgi:hypothetical protein|nr:hypothetical protein [Halobacteriovoraceae bacterium]MBT5094645.1 hypothetical protein [Halobacteriovoraceae bacterium]
MKAIFFTILYVAAVVLPMNAYFSISDSIKVVDTVEKKPPFNDEGPGGGGGKG